MSVRQRLPTLSRGLAVASAVWALLVGGAIAVYSLDIQFIDQCVGPDGQRYSICDPPQPLSLIGWTVIALLLAASIASVWKGWLWLLLAAWGLMLCLLLADTVWYLIPSVRQHAGLRGDLEIGNVLATELSRPFFLVCLFGFLLAMTAIFAARRRES
jgi:hypothetical protein